MKTPLHDRNGNMTAMPNAKTPTDGCLATYDAWNRLVKVETDDTIPVPIAHYQYDGLGRRIRKYVPGTPNSYQHFYYNAAWQILETRESSSSSTIPTTAQYQYVWSLRYIDAPILRDTDPSGTLVRHYYSTDANFNVTALYEDGDPTPVERYTYDPYGNVTIYNVDWTATRTTSLYNNSTLYTGQWHDPETGLMNYRNRYYHPTLGRFISRDPIGYGDGLNVYQYAGCGPLNRVDPEGDFWSIVVTALFVAADSYDYYKGNISGKEYAARMAVNVAAAGADVLSGGMGGGFAVRAGVAAARATRVAAAVGLRGARGAIGARNAYRGYRTAQQAGRIVRTAWRVNSAIDVGVGVANTAIGVKNIATQAVNGCDELQYWDYLRMGFDTFRTGYGAYQGVQGLRGLQQSCKMFTNRHGGGKLGVPATRAHAAYVGETLRGRGYRITGGEMARPEEYIRGRGPGTKGSVYLDITATKNGRTVRVNTVNTLSDGVSPTLREANNAARYRDLRPNEPLILIPKPAGF